MEPLEACLGRNPEQKVFAELRVAEQTDSSSATLRGVEVQRAHRSDGNGVARVACEHDLAFGFLQAIQGCLV